MRDMPRGKILLSFCHLTTQIQRYEEELNHTRVQLEEAKAANREQKKIKSSIEQKMKQAFLRSVKHLNLEAFHLVNELPTEEDTTMPTAQKQNLLTASNEIQLP